LDGSDDEEVIFANFFANFLRFFAGALFGFGLYAKTASAMASNAFGTFSDVFVIG
jgi:hypothetical protein